MSVIKLVGHSNTYDVFFSDELRSTIKRLLARHSVTYAIRALRAHSTVFGVLNDGAKQFYLISNIFDVINK